MSVLPVFTNAGAAQYFCPAEYPAPGTTGQITINIIRLVKLLNDE